MAEVKKTDKVRIVSDGTTTGTHVFIDGIEVANLQGVKFEAKNNQTLIKLNMTYVYPEMVSVETGDTNADA
jgi:hypothetical protein